MITDSHNPHGSFEIEQSQNDLFHYQFAENATEELIAAFAVSTPRHSLLAKSRQS
jgi:hypothetical protein